MTENSVTNKPKVIAIVGATASGKTAYSIELAKKINGEIISADSRLVYKGFNTACAKPTIEEQAGIPHHMINIIEPTFDFSSGLYQKQAKICIQKILAKGKTPIIVGGTGLYFRVLLENYDLPKIETNYELREQLKTLDKETLYDKLFELDSSGAKKIDKNDKKKVIRALEIIYATGKHLSEVQGLKEPEFNVEWIGCNFPREILYERINKRVEVMFENGIIEETQQLIQKYGRIPNITDTIGYREVLSYLDGMFTLEECKNQLKQNTRNYAKRQLTWFRKNELIKWSHYPEKLKK